MASFLRPESNDVAIGVKDVSDYAHAIGNLSSGTMLFVARISFRAHLRRVLKRRRVMEGENRGHAF